MFAEERETRSTVWMLKIWKILFDWLVNYFCLFYVCVHIYVWNISQHKCDSFSFFIRDFTSRRLNLSRNIRDGLFVIFRTPSRTPFQSDNAIAVVGTRHNNLVTRVSSFTSSRIPYVFSVSHIQLSGCPDGIVSMNSQKIVKERIEVWVKLTKRNGKQGIMQENITYTWLAKSTEINR